MLETPFDVALAALLGLSLAVLAYVLVGYGLLAELLVRLGCGRTPFPYRDVPDAELPRIRLVIAACDEEAVLPRKLENTLALDYPKDRLHVVIAADGSRDRTVELARAAPAVTVLHRPERRGKLAAVHRALEGADEELFVFSDANGFFNREALRLLARRFQDPDVGCVAGEKRVLRHDRSTSGDGEGLYWRYESWLKRLDARLHSACGAAGEIFAIRREHYELVPADSIIEDFHLSLRVAQRGFRVDYEPGAYAEELPTQSLAEEWKRRTRVAQGGFQSMVRLIGLLNPLRYGFLSFCLLSHRYLRWGAAPLALVGALIAAPWLWARTGAPLFAAVTLAQLGCYGLALGGFLSERRGRKPAPLYYPFFFVLLHAAALVGLFRWLRGRPNTVWARAKRTEGAPIEGAS